MTRSWSPPGQQRERVIRQHVAVGHRLEGEPGNRPREGPDAAGLGCIEVLNDAYSFGQFFVPAGGMTPTEGFPSILTTKTTTGGGLHHTHTVMKYPPSIFTSSSFDWTFKSDFAAGTDLSLKLRCGVIYFTEDSADSPDNIVRFDIGAVNLVMGDDINVGPNTETSILSDVQPASTPVGQQLLNGGDTLSKQNVPLTDLNGLVGTPISSTDWNFLNFNIERAGDQIEDTFSGDVFIFGAVVQFATDFNNIAQWPG